MWEVVMFAIAGLIGGLIRAIVTGKGLIALPRIQSRDRARYLNLGVLAPMAIGAFAGWLAPHALGVDAVVAALAGYSGTDFIENLIERGKKLP